MRKLGKSANCTWNCIRGGAHATTMVMCQRKRNAKKNDRPLIREVFYTHTHTLNTLCLAINYVYSIIVFRFVSCKSGRKKAKTNLILYFGKSVFHFDAMTGPGGRRTSKPRSLWLIFFIFFFSFFFFFFKYYDILV